MKNRLREKIADIYSTLEDDIKHIPYMILITIIWFCGFKLSFQNVWLNSLFEDGSVFKVFIPFAIGVVLVVVFSLFILLLRIFYDKRHK